MEQNTNTNEETYIIPLKFRKLENLHIIFWLLKDMSWAMLWKPIAMTMIVPTLLIASYIAYNSRNIKAEFLHNLAILFWIMANCYWMYTEFYFPEKQYEHLRFYSAIPFSIGVIIIATHYLPLLFKKNK